MPQVSPLQFRPFTVQATPELSFVVAMIESVWVIARPARCGDTDTEMLATASMVRVTLRDLLCGGRLESTTVNVRNATSASPVRVPVISPVAPFSAKPPDKRPLVKDHT